MFFEHVYDKTLAQASYVIGCQKTGESIVIDPKRDIDTYLEIAKQNNLKITHIAETHIHADFLAGTRELAEVTGAKMYLSDEGGEEWQYEFAHEGIKDGDTIKVGNVTFKVIHTPGHTPESVSFLLTDHPATDKPVMLFTGDFVFVGDVGRPDLLEKSAGKKGSQIQGAEDLFKSLPLFSNQPEYVQVWPGHGAGSSCGKSLGAVPNSTVGYELIRNWAFQFGEDKKAFVDTLLDGQPEAPTYFSMMKKLNKVDRPLLTKVPQHKKLSVSELKSALENNVPIIDTRSKDDFAKGHLPNSIHIEGNKSFPNWAGWLISYDKPFILVAEADKMEDLTRKLMRIGLDDVKGFISNIHQTEIPLETTETISKKEFKSYLKKEDTQIFDVRNESEYKSGHIEGAENLFFGTLTDNIEQLDKNKKIVVHCQSGARAAIAESLLAKNGFQDVKVYSGGFQEWTDDKEPVVNN